MPFEIIIRDKEVIGIDAARILLLLLLYGFLILLRLFGQILLHHLGVGTVMHWI